MGKIVTPDAANIQMAAGLIRTGKLVAFPTETVYGLGADALNPEAVARIFEAKGRPANNPLIVHVASAEDAASIAELNDQAQLLIDAFWPGPLTIVLKRKSIVPEIVTAGGDTVAIRMPNHPVALALIKAAETPIAAPSANRSERLSPTRASHVLHSLRDRIEIIIDGGPTAIGLESTVLNLSAGNPVILRPGMITADQIAGILQVEPQSLIMNKSKDADSKKLLSPGMMLRHYAPRTKLVIVAEAWDAAKETDASVAVLTTTPYTTIPENVIAYRVLPNDPSAYAAALYDVLHQLDECGAATILVNDIPSTGDWLAIRDRLTRASA